MKSTKQSQNHRFGRPSPRKLRARLNAWRVWANGMSLLRQIHSEIKDTLAARENAQDALENAGKWNA